MKEPLKLKTAPLPPGLRALCNRLASERAKAHVWNGDKRLRQFVQQMLIEGASSIEVTAWLAQQLAEAQQAQRTG
jgi:hypothetical protein